MVLIWIGHGRLREGNCTRAPVTITGVYMKHNAVVEIVISDSGLELMWMRRERIMIEMPCFDDRLISDWLESMTSAHAQKQILVRRVVEMQ